jgi:hypothetical protein
MNTRLSAKAAEAAITNAQAKNAWMERMSHQGMRNRPHSISPKG